MRRTAVDRARFAWHDVQGFVRRVYEGAAEANVPFLASGLTFDALIAAVPLLLLLLSVAGYVLSARADRAQLELSVYLRRFLPNAPPGVADDPFRPIVELFQHLIEQRGTFGLLGVPLFVWLSTRLFGSLRAALNEVFDTDDRRSWLRGKAEDLTLVIVVTALFIFNTALGLGVELVASRYPVLGVYQFLAAQLLAFVAIVVLFALIFRYTVAHRIRRDTTLFAALICAFGFEIARYVLGAYMQSMIGTGRLVTDATLGALLAFVIWTYYMAFVFLVGGQIAQVYELRRRQAQQRWLIT